MLVERLVEFGRRVGGGWWFVIDRVSVVHDF